jgi:hypothetical protein
VAAAGVEAAEEDEEDDEAEAAGVLVEDAGVDVVGAAVVGAEGVAPFFFLVGFLYGFFEGSALPVKPLSVATSLGPPGVTTNCGIRLVYHPSTSYYPYSDQ